MKNLMDKHTIINLKQKGLSNRKVALLTNYDRKTVAAYWNEFNNCMKNLKGPDADTLIIQEKMASPPKYQSSNRNKVKYTMEVDEFVDSVLLEEKAKDKALGLHKQKLTNAQIFERVKEAGFDVGITTVSSHIKIKREKLKECFIRQEYDYGDRLEYDFGEVKLLINGNKDKYHMAVFSSPASNFRWAYLYKSQNNEVFMDSHIRFFNMLGGIHKEIVYDNMRNVVSKFIGRNEKELNPNLLMMSNYYEFKINVTNCFSGNEKGHVEGSVKYIRNKVFAAKYSFKSYEEACQYLEAKLIVINENSGVQEEIYSLRKSKPNLELGKISSPKVNAYSFVQVDKNFYSVPDYLVGKTVTSRLYVDKVRIFSNEILVCEHKRKDGANEISIDINHYLSSLAKKPGALRNSLALKSLPQLKTIFDNHFNRDPKKFIDILIENKEKSMEDLISILGAYSAFSINVLPIDISPQQSAIERNTIAQAAMYNKLCIRSVN